MAVHPRRVFASSFVITVAVSGLAAADTPASKKPPPKEPPQAEAPKTDRHWRIYKQDKACFADSSADACPPPPPGGPTASCNPPPPKKYACPENVTLPVNIIQRANTTECYVDYGNLSCPPNMACNPPPPKKLACP